MIDQASVKADQYKNNRQALQAAVLGQNTEVDPYTALRALQLLKQSDSMEMAQKAQQPTDAPSLLQEAMQPPQMPMGMPIPGQQMAQAPQQGGGLEAMPVPEGDYAGGGIVAFAGGGSGEIEMLRQKAQDAKRLYEAAAKSGDTRASDLYMRQRLDAEAALAEAMKGPEETGSAMYGKGPTIGLPNIDLPSVEDFTRFAGRNIKQEVDPAKLAEDRARSAAQVAQIPDETAGGPVVPPSFSQTSAPPNGMTLRALEAQAGISDGSDVQAPSMMSPDGTPLRSLEARARIPDGSDPIPKQEDGKQAPPIQTAGQTVPPPATQTGTGLGALATTSPLGTELDNRLKALSEFAFTDSKITPPRTLQEKITSAKTGTFEALKGLYGNDEASAKAQAILDKRLADLDDPDSKKFDKALAWFKGAAAIQKGRGLGALAEGAAEVASTYSTIKKEDRKARTLIEDSQMALDRAAQARKEGLVGKAFDLEEKADADRTKAEQLQADIAAKKDKARADMLGTAAQVTYQRYNTDVTAMTATERNRLTAEANILSKQGLLDQATDRALSAAATLVRQTEADIGRERNQDKDYTEALSIVSTMDGRKLSPQAKNMLDKAKVTISNREKSDQKRLDAAQRDYSMLARRAIDQANKTKTKTDPTLPPGFKRDK